MSARVDEDKLRGKVTAELVFGHVEKVVGPSHVLEMALVSVSVSASASVNVSVNRQWICTF